MTRMLAVAAALVVLGCGSESDISQPGGGGSGHAAGYALTSCAYVCGSLTGHSSNSSCASGSSARESCGGPTKQQCIPPNACMTCYNVRWVCE
jgi:hypothetical protein